MSGNMIELTDIVDDTEDVDIPLSGCMHDAFVNSIVMSHDVAEPMDADGEPWDADDGAFINDAGERKLLCGTMFNCSDRVWYLIDEDERACRADMCRHFKTGLVRELLHAFADTTASEDFNWGTDLEGAIDEYYDMLREAYVGEICSPEETETIVCHNGDETITVHVMECDRCGGEYEHVNGNYEYCPRCRARIEE